MVCQKSACAVGLVIGVQVWKQGRCGRYGLQHVMILYSEGPHGLGIGVGDGELEFRLWGEKGTG